MTAVKKFYAVPSEQMEEGNEPIEPSIPQPKMSHRKNVMDNFFKKLKIILKLAKIDAYEVDGRIKDISGKIVDGSNIIDLLMHVTSHGKSLRGLDQFVELLFKAGVEPDIINNHDLKSRLKEMYNKDSKTTPVEPEEETRVEETIEPSNGIFDDINTDIADNAIYSTEPPPDKWNTTTPYEKATQEKTTKERGAKRKAPSLNIETEIEFDKEQDRQSKKAKRPAIQWITPEA